MDDKNKSSSVSVVAVTDEEVDSTLVLASQLLSTVRRTCELRTLDDSVALAAMLIATVQAAKDINVTEAQVQDSVRELFLDMRTAQASSTRGVN